MSRHKGETEEHARTRLREYHKEWRDKNAEHVRVYGREASRKWRKDNPEKAREVNRKTRAKNLEKHRECQRNSNFKRSHGITRDQADAMTKAQDGKCAICDWESTGDYHGERLFVDHDHATGKIREMLCHSCNASLGLVKENIDTLMKMVAYIVKHTENF